MTLIEELMLSMIIVRDFVSRWSVIFIVLRIPYKYCTTDGVLRDYGMPTVLDVA